MTTKAAPATVLEIVSTQLGHQVRVTRRRMTWWIPLIFVVGFVVSILGLIPAASTSLRLGSPTIGLFVFATFTAFFVWTVLGWLLFPWRLSPRIVPYFTREVGEYQGPSTSAFLRGRALYLAITELEAASARLGVRPFSTFGFAYDHYGQEVHWHRATDGLSTAEACSET